jgi:hypothetical protein
MRAACGFLGSFAYSGAGARSNTARDWQGKERTTDGGLLELRDEVEGDAAGGNERPNRLEDLCARARQSTRCSRGQRQDTPGWATCGVRGRPLGLSM